LEAVEWLDSGWATRPRPRGGSISYRMVWIEYWNCHRRSG
jgi:hypothetical protein